MGVDARIDGNGVRIDRLGSSGADTDTYLQMSGRWWGQGLRALEPDLILVTLGTNDQGANVPLSIFKKNLQEMIERIWAVLPRAEIIFAPPADNALVGTTQKMRIYAITQQILAAQNNIGFFDTYGFMGSYVNSNSHLMYNNSSHLNAKGGAVFAAIIERELGYSRSNGIEDSPPLPLLPK
jgi:lysophospholipase L1-like esterase